MSDSDPASFVSQTRESKDFDLKGPMRWESSASECASLVADILGMANSGGGVIVIGVAEDETSATGWNRKGIPLEDVRTWDQTKVGEVVRQYAGTSVEFFIDRVTHDGRTFVVISVKPFRRHPFICEKSFEKPGVAGEKRFVLRRRAIYVRTDEAQTIELQSTEQFRDLIELAIQLRRDELLTWHGREASPSDSDLNGDQLQFLSAVTKAAFDTDSILVNTRDLDPAVVGGRSKSFIRERLEELARRDLLEIKRNLGEFGFDVQISNEGIRQGTRDYVLAEDRVRRAICRLGRTTAEELADRLDLPRLLVKQIAVDFAQRDLVSRSTTSDMTKIWRPRSELCDWDKIRHRKACVVIGPHFPNSGDTFRQSFQIELLNEGEYEARDIKVVSDANGAFPDEPHDALPFVIPAMTSEPSRRYRAGFSVPWPDRDEQGNPIQGQEKLVRVKVSFRDGLDDRDTATFTILLRNNETPNRWSAQELKHKASLSPICQGSRLESA